MRICFYTDQTISGMTGGIGRVTAVLTEYFRHQFGWQVYSIYAAEAASDCVRTEVDGSICLRLHDRLGLQSKVRHNYPLAAAWLKQQQIDILVVQTSLDVVARMKRLLPGLRIYSVLHFEPGKDEWRWRSGLSVKGLLAPLCNLFIHRATLSAYRSALLEGDGVAVLSPAYIDLYRSYCGVKAEGNLFALPNPLSFATTYHPQQLIEKKKVVLVVARMEEQQKRLSMVLQLWQQLQNEGYELKLVGEGPSLNAYKKQAAAMGLQHIRFEGRQNPVPYYEEAALFLMTSSFEGFPMTLVEAQQYGCVSVAFDAFAALGDVVSDGRNGRVVKNNDLKVMATVVRELMHDDVQRRQLAEGALADCQRFSQATVAGEWKKLFEQ